MSNILSRRQFLKEVGLAGAGVVLAPMAAKGLSAEYINDAADTALPTAEVQRPSWVKESNKPTTEIDWNAMQRFDERNTCRGGLPKYVGADTGRAWTKMQNDNLAQWLKEGKPGYTLKDVALAGGLGAGSGAQSFLGPEKVTTPEDRGVPDWTGTPEEANAIVTAALRHLGAATYRRCRARSRNHREADLRR